MMRVGHYGAAMLAYLPVLLVLGSAHRTLSIAGLGGTLVGARLPDLDQSVPFVPHRGPTHTVWFAAVVGLLTAGAVHSMVPSLRFPALLVIGFAPALGVLSHLFADAITPAGVRPLWPASDRLLSAGLVRAENGLANRLLFTFGLLLVVFVLADGSLALLSGG